VTPAGALPFVCWLVRAAIRGATAKESVGASQASVSQRLTVQVNAIAKVPTLTLNPPTSNVSRSLINTSWEGVCDTTTGATYIADDEFAGWDMLPVTRGKTAAFQIWGNGDKMQNAQGKQTIVNAANGAGQEWLGLSNGVGSSYQSPGISQNINTIDGVQYTFNFDYVGQLGLSSANTQIGVYLDGQLLGAYSNTSANILNWQMLNYSFKGDGKAHTLSVQLSNGTNTTVARGAMIDALSLVETLPQSASTVYGFAGKAIALPKISDQLADNDPNGKLNTTLVGLPVGAIVSDGTHSTTINSTNTVLNISGWNLNTLALTLPQHYLTRDDDSRDDDRDNCGDGTSSNSSTLNLQVAATSVEAADNGSMASTAKNVTVQLLTGQACTTPVGVNPYVSYVNSASKAQVMLPNDNPIIVASPLVPVSNSHTITLNGTSATGSTTPQASLQELEASMERLLENLSQAVGVALRKELTNLLQKG